MRKDVQNVFRRVFIFRDLVLLELVVCGTCYLTSALVCCVVPIPAAVWGRGGQSAAECSRAALHLVPPAPRLHTGRGRHLGSA